MGYQIVNFVCKVGFLTYLDGVSIVNLISKQLLYLFILSPLWLNNVEKKKSKYNILYEKV